MNWTSEDWIVVLVGIFSLIAGYLAIYFNYQRSLFTVPLIGSMWFASYIFGRLMERVYGD